MLSLPDPFLSLIRCLDERLVAAESCWFASKILKESKDRLFVVLPEYSHADCTHYITELQQVVGQLQSLVYRGICPELCLSDGVMLKLTECQWADSKKQSDGPNAWVECLANNCKEVWEFLNEENENAVVHVLAREQLWMELCQAAFDVALDSFSKAKKSNAVVGSTTTSSEGCRAAMIVDLRELQKSLEAIHSCRPARGKEHVEEFVRATGLPEDEMIQWVRSNWQIYAYQHLYALISQTLASVMKKTKLKDCLLILDSLYDQEQKFQEGPKVRRSILGFTKS
jgi:Protein of unknown function C-terminus (DUF2451)